MNKRTKVADSIPQWLTKKRVRMLLLCSGILLSAGSIILWIYVDNWLFRRNAILYNIPIALYCLLWFHEVSERRDTIPFLCFVLDICVVVLSMLRGYSSFGVLLFSGHMLFLVYSGWEWRYNQWLRYISLLILIQVAYWKLILWDDWRSFILGLCVAILALVLRNYIKRSIYV